MEQNRDILDIKEIIKNTRDYISSTEKCLLDAKELLSYLEINFKELK